MNLLFVCTGNICRSPTAERLAVAYGSELKISNFTATSAGTRAVIASPMHPDAALVLEKLGGEPSRFAARQLTSRIASDADLVLTMTSVQRKTVLEIAPRLLRRTFTLTEAANLASEFNPRDITELAALRPYLGSYAPSDVSDPIGQDPEVFARVGSQIASLLPPILELCGRSTGFDIEARAKP